MLQVLVAISQKFCYRKETWDYAKVIHKKREKKKKRWEKWTSVQDIENNGYSDACVKKREEKMNKISHVFLQSCFQVLKERYVFKEQSRIRLATTYIYPPYIHTHALLDLIVWLNSLWIRGLTLQYMYCKYALSYFFHSYELHISFSYRKKERHNITFALVTIHKYHIYWETWECHTMEALSFI